MTQRKPLGTGWTSWIDQQVAAAERRGEFENLPGKGKPIEGLDQPYDHDWWLRQKMKAENLEYLPPALELRRDIHVAVEKLWTLKRADAVRAQVRVINGRIAKANREVTSGPASTLAPLNEAAVLETWRQRRAGR